MNASYYDNLPALFDLTEDSDKIYATAKLRYRRTGSTEDCYISCGKANVSSDRQYSFVTLNDGCIVLVCAMLLFNHEECLCFGLELNEASPDSVHLTSHSRTIDYATPFKIYSWRRTRVGNFVRRSFFSGDIEDVADVKPLHGVGSSPDLRNPNIENDMFFCVGSFLDRTPDIDYVGFLTESDSLDAYEFIRSNESTGQCLTTFAVTPDDDCGNEECEDSS